MNVRRAKSPFGAALAIALAALILIPFLPGQTTGDAGAQGNDGAISPLAALGVLGVQAHMLPGTEPWLDLLVKASGESGVPWQVLAAVMNLESGGDASALSPTGAVGLMQVMPEFWQEQANAYGGDLADPWVNVRTAAEVLAKAHATWGTWDKAAAAYFGAIDDAGNITGATDAYGTTGYEYVERFLYNIASVGFGPQLANDYLAPLLDTLPAATATALGFALGAQGESYVLGGESPAEGGFDCSGLVQWAYAQVGIDLPRTAAEQWEWTPTIDEADLLPGDLVFFAGTTDEPGVTHEAMYVGNGLMINAPDVDDIVRLVPLDNPWWRDHLVGFSRVVQVEQP